jgi:hypothetical protein
MALRQAVMGNPGQDGLLRLLAGRGNPDGQLKLGQGGLQISGHNEKEIDGKSASGC